MGSVSKTINRILLFLATGKVPKVGRLFRIKPSSPDVVILHDFPNNGTSPYNCRRFLVDPNRGATFLITKVQENVPLWDLWIQVLFCSMAKDSKEEIAVGWISYLEFNRIVLAEWYQWEEEENQKENSR